MSLPTRRVHRAALEAPDEAMVRRGAVLLEDALRTATLGGDGGRLVLVRRLDAGVIRPGGSSASVALALERSYRRVESFAVHGGDPSAPSAGAVWFSDAVEAHAVLASRLALGEVPSAWFWRLAVPAWRADLPRGEALRVVLASAAATEAGAGAVVSLVAELRALGGLGGLLDALRPADGGALLAACGWTMPSSALPSDPGASPPVSPGTAAGGVDAVWRMLVAERAREWGEGDARTLWLAAVALVADAPARMLDPALPRRARALVTAMARASGPASSVEAGTAGSGIADSASAAASPSSASTTTTDANDVSARAGEDSESDKVVKVADVDPGDAGAEARSASTESVETADSTESVAPAKTVDSADPAEAVSVEAKPSSDAESAEAAKAVAGRAEGEAEPLPDRESPVGRAQAPGDRADDRAGAIEGEGTVDAPGARSLDARSRETAAEGEATRTVERRAESEGGRGSSPSAKDRVEPEEGAEGEAGPRRRAVTDGVPRATDGAGLLFLVPVLERLGMTALLRDQPHLVNADLPARVLARVARRVGVPAGDPVLEVFPAPVRDPGPLPFAWPPVWKRGIAREGAWPVRRAAGQGRRRVLFDASGRLPLAAWHGEAPERVAALANLVESGDGGEARTDADLLVEAWAMALRRWCRRYARMGLRAVVLRPGRVAATRTHVDLLMDHRRADLRVRRAGMDIDPGWVAWLGRVVGFHYLHGEERGLHGGERG